MFYLSMNKKKGDFSKILKELESARLDTINKEIELDTNCNFLTKTLYWINWTMVNIDLLILLGIPLLPPPSFFIIKHKILVLSSQNHISVCPTGLSLVTKLPRPDNHFLSLSCFGPPKKPQNFPLCQCSPFIWKMGGENSQKHPPDSLHFYQDVLCPLNQPFLKVIKQANKIKTKNDN